MPLESARSATPSSSADMTGDELAEFYRRYNACCNEHGFEELGEFVAPDVVINGADRGLDAYADALRSVVRPFPDYRWELRQLVVDPPWIAAHLEDTGTHSGPQLELAVDRRVPTP